ncbi:MAG: NUMOD3 domain-containing DNA-binding protein [Nitrososphaerales archaeon]
MSSTKGKIRPDTVLRNLNNNPMKIPEIVAKAMRIRRSFSGVNNPMFGKSRPDLVLFNRSARDPLRRSDVIQKTRERNSIRNRGEGNPMYGRTPNYPKRRFVQEIEQFVRSTWEEAVCRYLQANKISYQYEKIRYYGTVNGRNVSWLPDLIIEDCVVEIKGALYDWQIEKYDAIIKANELKVIIITSKRYFEKAKRAAVFVVSFNDFEEELPSLLNKFIS